MLASIYVYLSGELSLTFLVSSIFMVGGIRVAIIHTEGLPLLLCFESVSDMAGDTPVANQLSAGTSAPVAQPLPHVPIFMVFTFDHEKPYFHKMVLLIHGMCHFLKRFASPPHQLYEFSTTEQIPQS